MSDSSPPISDFTPEPGTLVIEDQSLRYGFIQLPKQVLKARNLTRDAKLLYAVLLSYAWEQGSCFPGYGRLCQDMGATEKVVRKYMQELEAAGLVAQKRRGLGLTNVYRLPDLRNAKLDFPERSKTPVQERYGPEQSKTPVLEQSEAPVAERSKTPGKVETVKQETDRHPSNLRKVTNHKGRGTETGPNGSQNAADTPAATNAKARVRAKLARARQGGPTGQGFSRPGELIADETSDETDRPPASGRHYGEDRQVLVSYMTDLARELGDQAELTSTVSRANNLMDRAGLNLDAFIPLLYEARAKTQERTGSITSRGDQKDPWGQQRKNKMAYFFSVLEDMLGFKSNRSNDRQQTRNTG